MCCSPWVTKSDITEQLNNNRIQFPLLWSKTLLLIHAIYISFLEKEMVSHSSIVAWKIPWIEELGGLHSLGLQRVRHDLGTEHAR